MSSGDARPAAAGSNDAAAHTVTLYSVNGLCDGNTNWLGHVLPRFTDDTGIVVDYVEEHSRAIVQLLKDESSAPRADVLITLPPFIHMAAHDGLLEAYQPAAAEKTAPHDRDPAGHYCMLIRDYPDFIYNRSIPAPPPVCYTDFLAPRFSRKIQYSRPGWSGAGTAFLLQVFHAFGGKQAGLEFLKELQANCLEPTEHTSGLAEMVDAGELFAANGDVQTNFPQIGDHPNMGILFPAAPDGKCYAFEFSYYVALARGAPNPANGKKLIDYLLGEYAQGQVGQLAQGLPAREDIKPDDENYRQLTALLETVEIWEPDWPGISRTLDDDVAAYERMVFGR